LEEEGNKERKKNLYGLPAKRRAATFILGKRERGERAEKGQALFFGKKKKKKVASLQQGPPTAKTKKGEKKRNSCCLHYGEKASLSFLQHRVMAGIKEKKKKRKKGEG